MTKQKKTKFGGTKRKGGIYQQLLKKSTKVKSGTLTLAKMQKLWNAIESSSSVPHYYIDYKGMHKINVKTRNTSSDRNTQ